MFIKKMKMLKIVVFALVALLLVTIKANPLHLEHFEVIELEEPCVRQGGMCLRVDDCDPGNIANPQGLLCPKQQHKGVTCCYI